MKPPPAMTGHSMADQIDLKQLFTQALEQGLEHGTDALVAKMVEAYNITEDQVRGHLLEIYPPQGEFRAVLRINNDSVINWFGSINLTGAPSFEIKRGHMMIVEDAFGGTMPTGHEGIFMRLGTYTEMAAEVPAEEHYPDHEQTRDLEICEEDAVGNVRWEV